MASEWKPPDFMDEALDKNAGSFLNEKKRHTGTGKKKEQPIKKKKKKKKKTKKVKTPTAVAEVEPPTPEPVQITYEDWLLSALKTLDASLLDTNGNNMIHLSQFQAHFKEINPDLAETIFIDIDVDKDKWITTYQYEVWRNLLDSNSLQNLRDNYQKYPEEQKKEPTPEPEPEPEPELEPEPEQKKEPIQYIVKPKVKKAVKNIDDSSLLAILKTMDYESMGNNNEIHWNEFRDYLNRFNHINISNDDSLKIFNDIDTNRDKYISHKQYKIWINKLNSLHLDIILKQKQINNINNYGQYNKNENNYNQKQNIDTDSLLSFLKTMDAKSLDVNNNNTIQFGEMVNYFKRHYNKYMNDENIKKLFYDINGNYNYAHINLDAFNQWIGRLNSLHLEKILKGGLKESNQSNGMYESFSVNHADIIWLCSILKNLNLSVLDYGKTNTITLDSFQNYFASLNKKVPNFIVTNVWNRIDQQKIGRIAYGEYSRFINGLNENKLKEICLE